MLSKPSQAGLCYCCYYSVPLRLPPPEYTYSTVQYIVEYSTVQYSIDWKHHPSMCTLGGGSLSVT